jgi:hypothetical protein
MKAEGPTRTLLRALRDAPDRCLPFGTLPGFLRDADLLASAYVEGLIRVQVLCFVGPRIPDDGLSPLERQLEVLRGPREIAAAMARLGDPDLPPFHGWDALPQNFKMRETLQELLDGEGKGRVHLTPKGVCAFPSTTTPALTPPRAEGLRVLRKLYREHRRPIRPTEVQKENEKERRKDPTRTKITNAPAVLGWLAKNGYAHQPDGPGTYVPLD